MLTKYYINSCNKLTQSTRGFAISYQSQYRSNLVDLRAVLPQTEKLTKSHKTQAILRKTQLNGFKHNTLGRMINSSFHSSSQRPAKLTEIFSRMCPKGSVALSMVRNKVPATSNQCLYSTKSEFNEEDEEKVRNNKTYVEAENIGLYSILLSIPDLNNTLAPQFKAVDKEDIISDDEFHSLIKSDFSHLDKHEILEAFKKVTYYIYDKEDSLANASFDNLCNALVKSMGDFTDNEICKLMFLLQIWSPKCFRKEKNYFNIYSTIDRVHIERFTKGGIENYSLYQLLHMLDFWSHLNLLRASNFCKLALKKLLNKCHQLDPHSFVQLMYYHCRYRTFHPLVNAYDVEFVFEKMYDELSAKEIAIVLLAFFKSQKLFHSHNLCVKIAKSFTNHAEELDSVCMNAYLKSMKYYFPLQHWNILYQVSEKLYEVIESKGHMVLGNAAVVGTKIDVYHPKLIDKIVEIALKNIESLRIKDLEKILFPIVIFNHKVKQPEILDLITQEFISDKRQKEIEQFPKTLFSLVHHLILLQQFNSELIGKCLDIEFLEKCFGKRLTGYVLPKDLLFVDFSTEIEYPDYTGPVLPEDLRHILCKHYAWRKPGELFHNKVVRADELSITVQSKLNQMLGGEKFTHLAYVLPHFIKPDVLICLKDGKAVTIPESMSDFVYMSAYPPPATGKWFALVFITFSQIINKAEKIYKGPFMCKLRQLKLLGYEPIVITTNEWKDETDQAREQILRDKLGEYLQPGNDSVSMEQKT